MQFVIPLLCNANKEPIGVFSTKTNADGDLVVLFSNKAKWDRFARAEVVGSIPIRPAGAAEQWS